VSIAQKFDLPSTLTDKTFTKRIAIVGQRNFFVDGIVSMLEADAWHEIVMLEDRISSNFVFSASLPDILFIHSGSMPVSPDEFIKVLLLKNPGIKILIFGQGMSDDYLFSVVQAGAYGYLNEKMTGSHLTSAIDAVLKGGYWVERHIMARLISGCSIRTSISSRVEALGSKLTRRETEVLEMVMKGFDTKEIAEHIYLSHHSVKAHLGNLFKKFEVKNRAQLILRAIDDVCPIGSLSRMVQQGLQEQRSSKLQ
jgi:DNA-binding NarL/FixJ family response regulator